MLAPLLLIAASLATSHQLRQAIRTVPVMSAPAVPGAAPARSWPVNLALLQRHLPHALETEASLASADPQEQHLPAGERDPNAIPLARDPRAGTFAQNDPPTLHEPADDVASPPGVTRHSWPPNGAPTDFGLRLAAAALSQTKDPVTYSAKYQSIAYPMGDISPLEGACTDVIIRAYRALGIDLQVLVHHSRVGAGDPSIDHRRTETLRKFFARYAASLPVTAYPEDYRPGDIVTYYRPFSRVSRAHIAIVSDVLAPTRRPMIVHNRGWGVQLEDALFVDHITGHYRLSDTSSALVLTSPGAGQAIRRIATTQQSRPQHRR